MSWTVSAGTRLYAWKMKPTCSRRNSVRRRSEYPDRSWPPIMTRPVVGVSSPEAQWRKVLFPDPDGPMTAVKVPGSRRRLTPRSACTSPPGDG